MAVKLSASHIIGGEMTMEHAFGSRYELSVRLFYDAEDGQDVVEDSIIATSFRRGDNQKIENYFMTRSLNYESPDLSNSFCKEGLNIRIYTYKATVFLDENLYSSPSGYYFSWQRCCRANGISNILNSGTTGFVFYHEFPSPDNVPANSSPKFKAISGDYYCTGEPVEIDFGATDADNDDLVYTIMTPLAGFSRPDDNVIVGQPGPYPSVNGYFDVSSQNGVQIDNEGVLLFVPSQSGLYTVAVLCEEFRSGQKIGSVIRDLVILIRDCESNVAPEITFYPYGGSDPYLIGDTIFLRNTNDLCHLFNVYDADGLTTIGGEVIYISLEFLGPEIAAPELSGNNDPEGPNWSLCFPNCENPEVNFFTLRLIAKDDHCPVPAENFVDINFKIIESEDIPPIISTNYIPSDHSIGEEIRFDIQVYDPDSSGINISFSGEDFDPSSIEMNFSYQLDNCCEANGEFSWKPECSNILDQENYKLFFTARGNNCGIIGRDSLSVNLFVENSEGNIPDEFTFPNVITPNGDGINDKFYFPVLDDNLCLEKSFKEITVYNRWGREVYQSAESTFVWDAMNVNAGQYFYHVKFEDKAFKGFLHILK